MTQALLKITGHVQGVWYRATVRDFANRLGVTGYAKNLSDGSVEVMAQGERSKIDQLITACRKGSPSSQVSEIHASWKAKTSQEKLKDFTIF